MTATSLPTATPPTATPATATPATTTPTTAIHLEGTRFGAIVFDPAEAVVFPDGIIGFESARRFVTISAGENTPFLWLQSLDVPSLAFLLADPDAFAPGYAPGLPPSALASIGVETGSPYLLWVTANVPAGRPRDATLNLAAPIVVDPVSRRGAQIVLDGDAYNIRYRAFPSSEGTNAVPEHGDPARLAA